MNYAAILPDLLAVVIVFAVAFTGSLCAAFAWDRWTRHRKPRVIITGEWVSPVLAVKSPAERLADVTDPNWRSRSRGNEPGSAA
jgi:hypothetical protein